MSEHQRNRHAPKALALAAVFSCYAGLSFGAAGDASLKSINGSDRLSINGSDRLSINGSDRLSINGSDRLSINGSDRLSINGSDRLSINGSDRLSINGSDRLSINGSDRLSINGSDRLSINGSDRLSINGSDRLSINGSDRLSINGSDRLSINGSDRSAIEFGGLLARGSIEHVGADFVSVLGQTVFAAGNELSGLNVGTTIAVYGSIDAQTGGYVDTTIVALAEPGSAGDSPEYLRGTVDEVDTNLGLAVVSGVTVDYTGLLGSSAAPSVGGEFAVSGRNYRELGRFVAEPE